MRVKVIYDVDGTTIRKIKGHFITTQLFVGTTNALIRVKNKKGKITKTYHFSNVYMIERLT